SSPSLIFTSATRPPTLEPSRTSCISTTPGKRSAFLSPRHGQKYHASAAPTATSTRTTPTMALFMERLGPERWGSETARACAGRAAGSVPNLILCDGEENDPRDSKRGPELQNAT